MTAFTDKLDQLRKIVKRLNPDPCNKSVERRNAQTLKQLADLVVDAFDEVDPGTGAEITPFRVTERLNADDANARKVVWTGSAYDLGDSIVVHDWTTDDQFDCNLQVGAEGVAIKDPDRGEWNIVTLVGKARWVLGTFVSKDTTDPDDIQYTFDVDSYWGAYPNILDPGEQLSSVPDPAKVDPGLIVDDKAFLLWDDARCGYILHNAYKAPSNAVVDCLVRVNQTGLACSSTSPNSKCAYSGYTLELPSSPADLCDKLQDKDEVWLFDARNCSAPGTLKNDEHYLACKLLDNYNGAASGTDERPVYAVISEVSQTSSDKKIIEITDGSADCEERFESSECLYGAKISTQAFTGTEDACSDITWGGTVNIWARAINACECDHRVKKGDRFIGWEIHPSFGPTGDKRPLYIFRVADQEHMQIVTVKASDGENVGDPVRPDDTTLLFEGAVLKQVSGVIDGNADNPFEEHEDVYLVDISNSGDDKDKEREAIVGDRHFAKYLGKWSDDKCVYGFKAKPSGKTEAKWAIAVTNWYKPGEYPHFMHSELSGVRAAPILFPNSDTPSDFVYPECAYVIVKLVSACNSVEPDTDQPTEDPNWVTVDGGDKSGTQGLLVYLPTPNWQGDIDAGPPKTRVQKHVSIAPNVVTDDIISILKMEDGCYVCEGMGDGQIWANEVHIAKDVPLRPGWKYMNRSVATTLQNLRNYGGSGWTMEAHDGADYGGLMLREGEPVAANMADRDGGRACIPASQLKHRHAIFPSAGLPRRVATDSSGDAYALGPDDICTHNAEWGNVTTLVDNECGDDVRNIMIPIQDCEQDWWLPGEGGEDPPAGTTRGCCGEWGPFDIMNPWRWCRWWERVDNSQSFLDAWT